MTRTDGWMAMRVLAAGVLLLSGCASTTQPAAPCCYSGDYTLSRLADVRLVLADGRRVAFAGQFPGFTPDTGLFAPLLPFREVAPGDVDDARVAAVLAGYDANGDGLIEEPELARLIVREAAIGLGLRVEHLETDARVNALVLPPADTGGLMRWLRGKAPAMNADARALFAELERIGQDLRLRGGEGDGLESDADFDV